MDINQLVNQLLILIIAKEKKDIPDEPVCEEDYFGLMPALEDEDDDDN